MSDPIKTFVENTKEVKQLVAFHEAQTGNEPGRRYGVEILNKSGVVLLTACWEAFVEDCASSAFEFILQKTNDPAKLPKIVRKRVAREIKEDQNDSKVWDIAGIGWKTVLGGYKAKLLHTYVSFFNTPKAGNVDQLFEALIGLPNVSNNWSWQGLSTKGARQRLSDYVELRGAIAHRVEASRAVYKHTVNQYADFVTRLAVRTANITRVHVYSVVQDYPWNKYKWGDFQ